MKKSASNDKLNGTPSIKGDVDGVLLWHTQIQNCYIDALGCMRWGHADMKKSASNDKLNGTPSIKGDVDGVLLAMCVECSASVYCTVYCATLSVKMVRKLFLIYILEMSFKYQKMCKKVWRNS